MSPAHPTRRGARASKRGLTLIEVAISTVIATILVLATAAVFSENMQVVERSRGMTGGASFLGTTLESVSAQSYDNLLTLNGTRLFENTDADDSAYAVDLTTFLVEVGLVQVEAELVDLKSDRVVGRVLCQRADR